MNASNVGKLFVAFLRSESMNESTTARDPISVRHVGEAFPVQLICEDMHQFTVEQIRMFANNMRKSLVYFS